MTIATVEMCKDPTIEINEKRFYIPAIVRWKCGCGQANEEDLNDQYLSYPPQSRPFDEKFYCEKCDRSSVVTLKLTVTTLLEVVSETGSEDST